MARQRFQRSRFDVTFNRDTAQSIFTVTILALACLLLLSLFEFAGRVGVFVDQRMAFALGWPRIALPFFLLAIGIHELAPSRFILRVTQLVGFFLFFTSLNPLAHTISLIGTTGVTMDKAGGKLGLLLAEPAMQALGRAGAVILLAALFVVSLLLIFNTSLREVLQRAVQVSHFIRRVLSWIIAPIRWALARYTGWRAGRVRFEEERERLPLVQIPVGVSEKEALLSSEEGEEEEAFEASGKVPRQPVPRLRKRRPMVSIPIELLMKRDHKPTSGDLELHQSIIRRTLETFGIPVEMGEVAVGPTVTQFTLKPAEGVKLSKITALHNDLALALAAHPIRIEAPIPGKSLVGIEVPNQSVATVGLREMLESREWRELRAGLPFVLGRDVSGKPWVTDLARMPHLLVAGATGSGKSVCLNILITSLLYSFSPDELRFILVDPKRVELPVYNGVPHLLTPVITEVEKTVNALKWTIREMDRRFDILSRFGSRDLAAYNARSEEKLPAIVFVIDELADLIVTALQEVEGPIVRLAQMARAVGIHLVLATQRPSVDVITGLIKANIPARIAFAVASSVDSRTILDQVGAEKLLGRGDMLFQTSEMSSMKRLQGAFISEDEILRVVEFLKSHYEPAEVDAAVVEKQEGGRTAFAYGSQGGEGDSDELLPEAKEEILRAGKASASLLQRRLKVGYARAARILDLLEQEGFIGPADGAKPREILVRVDRSALEQVNREIPDIELDQEEREG